MYKTERSEPAAPAVGIPVKRVVGRPDQKLAELLAQIEACRRDVESWPAWMRASSTAPKWMAGWDDL